MSSGLTMLSTVFQSYHDGVWLLQAAQCDLVAPIFIHIYWAKVLTDHPKICDNCFVVKYFETNFGILNENAIWHQSYASAGTWLSSCSLHMCIYIKPLK